MLDKYGLFFISEVGMSADNKEALYKKLYKHAVEVTEAIKDKNFFYTTQEKIKQQVLITKDSVGEISDKGIYVAICLLIDGCEQFLVPNAAIAIKSLAKMVMLFEERDIVENKLQNYINSMDSKVENKIAVRLLKFISNETFRKILIDNKLTCYKDIASNSQDELTTLIFKHNEAIHRSMTGDVFRSSSENSASSSQSNDDLEEKIVSAEIIKAIYSYFSTENNNEPTEITRQHIFMLVYYMLSLISTNKLTLEQLKEDIEKGFNKKWDDEQINDKKEQLILITTIFDNIDYISEELLPKCESFKTLLSGTGDYYLTQQFLPKLPDLRKCVIKEKLKPEDFTSQTYLRPAAIMIVMHFYKQNRIDPEVGVTFVNKKNGSIASIVNGLNLILHLCLDHRKALLPKIKEELKKINDDDSFSNFTKSLPAILTATEARARI